ncbi:hypothetical protein FF38_10734 [Lucilia cuprina]|uniref:DUF4604 domain-containing protein n=1 Tax=Lucilia cuprina TaxID=7375 RepID=A0A0L0BVN9_LUCCU|nr:uncharacterized protein KIAA1143 homolog [Lucilia cuprina]KAI8123125.1 hypothetical protein CVS40_6121 [Lucilia cuprina]KAI8123127.1 hypothetical protein CVS40_6121 [Lucilia cuprina]KNC23304.1 hypothetical protein FF38_10734 [Lucilia cuprina]
MSKRNIAYIKPQDPKFLQQLKQQIGYKEGPSVETKRQKLQDFEGHSDNEDRPEREDEKPQIVVINSGDLTADEVALEEKRLAKEAAEEPADLNQPIVFRKRHKPGDDLALKSILPSTKDTKADKKNKDKPRQKSFVKSTVKLSFNPEEEEEDQ